MRLLWATLLLVGVAAFGQSFTPKTITFTGAPQYTQAELMTMSGLVAGRPLAQAEVDAAMQKLDASGLFASINYKAEGFALKIELEPIASGQARTLHYSNFVMATPEELNAQLHVRLPAFTGTIPVVGNLQQQVERALEAILKQRGIEATVASIGSESGALNYNITSPPVVVGKLEIASVDFAREPVLSAMRQRFEGGEYLEGLTNEALRKNLLDAFQDLGFVDFSIGPVGHGKPAITTSRIAVDLTGSAQPGPLYSVARLDLPAPAPGVHIEEIRAAVDLKPGGPASRILRLATETKVNNTFLAHGYFDAATVTTPVKDDVSRTVSYTLRTTPGERYTLRLFSAPSLTPEQEAKLKDAFKLAPGAMFEKSALFGLLTSAAGRTMCNGRPLEADSKPDRTRHQVDVVAGCKGKP